MVAFIITQGTIAGKCAGNRNLDEKV
jgi:hypothetical protein